jgi:integrase
MGRVFHNKGNWWIDFKDAQGVRHRKKVGPSKRVAQEVLDGILGSVARRQHLGIIEESSIGFAEFANEWMRRVEATLRPRSRERWFGIVEQHLKPAFLGSLRAITQADAQAYVCRRLKAGAGAATINREMTVLKHMMRRAVAWEYRSRNPFLDSQGNLVEGLKPLKEPPGRTRYLTVEEIDRLLAACSEAKAFFIDAQGKRRECRSPYLRPFVIIALNTGMRRNEILSLTRNTIDWENRMATVGDTKNGEAKHVYLNDAAIEALRSLPTRLDGRLFPLTPNQVTMLLGRAVKRAGLENFRLHDCRHTFASYQAMAGVQGRGLQVLLGHKDARMTMRYSHLSDQYLRAAVNGVVLGGRKPEPANKKDGTYLAPTDNEARVARAK